MPISSTDVSNIIGGQVGMFSASAQYAQAISSQYGFAPSGAPFGQDPRMAANIQMGGAMGSGLARAPGMALGGIGLMSMFGMAPRMFDPFTSTIHAGAMGMRAGGVGGAIGAGGMALAGYGALAGAGSWMTNQIATGAQNRMMTTGAINNVFPGMGMQGLNMMAGQVESMSRQGMGSIRELTGVMQGGAMSGALDTSTLSQFSMSFSKLVNNVRNVATALNTSMQQAQQAMQQVKSIGINSDQAAGFLGTARAFGATAGVSPGAMMNFAAGGASFARQAGIDRAVGATGAITQAGIYGLAQKQGMGGILPDSYSRHMQGASRFLMGSRGRTVLGAMFDPNTGGLDPQMAQLMSAGALTKSEIQAAYNRNVTGNRDMFGARRGELAASFMSQYGPQAVGGALNAMTAGSSRPSMLQQSLTGLTRSDIQGLQTLRANSDALSGQLINAARQGFREGQQQMSFGSALGQQWDKLIKPIKDEFRQIGAGLTKSMMGASQQMMSEFVRQPSLHATTGQMMQHISATQGGNRDYMSAWNATQSRLNYITNAAPSDSWSGYLASRLPSGFRLGRMAPGTTLDELPMMGFGTDSYSPGQSLALGGLAFAPGGRNYLGWAGQGINQLGRGIAALGGSPASTGFMGAGGIGGPGSWLRGAGNLVRGGGYALRGMGFLGRIAAPALIAGDLITNAAPAGMRAYGQTAISEGAITGNERRLAMSLINAGVIGEDGYSDLRVGSMAGGIGSTPEGMTPLSGFVSGPSGGQGGTQRFLTKKGMEVYVGVQDGSKEKEARKKLVKTDGERGTPESVISSVRRMIKDNENWEDMPASKQIGEVTKHIQSLGYKRITTQDAFSLVSGKGIVSDEIRASMEHADPSILHDNAIKLARDTHLIGVGSDLAMSTDGKLDHTKFGAEQFTEMAGAFQRAGGKWISLAGMRSKFGDDKQLNEMGLLPHNYQDMSDEEKAIFIGNRDPAVLGNVFAGRSDAWQAVVRGRVANKSRAGRMAWGVGSADKDDNFKYGVDSKRGLGRSWVAGFAATYFDNGDNIASLAAFRRRYAQADADGKAGVLRDYAAQLGHDPTFRRMSETGQGGLGGPGALSTARMLLADDGEFTLGQDLTQSFYAKDVHAVREGYQRRRNAFNESTTRVIGGNIAMRASGATTAGLEHYQGIQNIWAQTPTGDGTKGTMAARSQFIKMIQARMEAGYSNATGAQHAAAAKYGGAMTMQDAQRLYAELMESPDDVHRDMAAGLANFIQTRQMTRSAGGARRRASQVLRKLGIKVSAEDKSFLRGKSDVMSAALSGEIMNMAQQSLEAQFGASGYTTEQINERHAELVTALRNKGEGGKWDSSDWENIVSSQGGIRGVSQGTAGGGRGQGQLSSLADDFAAALSTATSALRGNNMTNPDGTPGKSPT